MDHNPCYTASNMLHCAQQCLDGVVVVSFSGEVDLANVSSFRVQLDTAAETAENLVLDLRDLRYIDSSGIKALLDVHCALARGGRSILMAAVPPMMRRMLEIVGLKQVIPVFPTVEAAVESLRPRRRGSAPNGAVNKAGPAVPK